MRREGGAEGRQGFVCIDGCSGVVCVCRWVCIVCIEGEGNAG